MLQGLFCMRLNTAGIVLGWLGVAGSFIGTIFLATTLGYADVIAQRIVQDKGNSELTYNEVHTALIIMLSVYLSLVVLNLLASSMLVLGTMKERHLMLLPWLINSGIGLVFSIIYNIAVIVVSIGNMGAGAILIILITAFVLGIQIYIYYGIYSLFKHIQLTRDQQQPLVQQPRGPPAVHQGDTYPSYTKI